MHRPILPQADDERTLLERYNTIFEGTRYEMDTEEALKGSFVWNDPAFKEDRFIDVESVWAPVLRLLDEHRRMVGFMLLLRTSPRHHAAPSSSTGRYHPPEDNGAAGQMIHEIKGVAQGLILCDVLGYAKGSEDYDRLILGLSLHDHAKNGIPSTFALEELPDNLKHRHNEDTRTSHTVNTHDVDMAMLLAHEAPRVIAVVAQGDEELEASLLEDFKQVTRCVSWHSGPWRSDRPTLTGGKVTHCIKCKTELPDNNAKYRRCPSCGQSNAQYGRATGEEIAYAQLSVVNDAGYLQGYTHMADYIVSRYSADGVWTMSEDDFATLRIVLPQLVEREHFVREFKDALMVLKKHLED